MEDRDFPRPAAALPGERGAASFLSSLLALSAAIEGSVTGAPPEPVREFARIRRIARGGAKRRRGGAGPSAGNGTR